MSKFIPIIQEGRYETIFRNDIVDIEFPVDGRDVTMRFDLSETAAPPLPLRYTGRLKLAGKNYYYAVDTTGGAWAENDEAVMTPIPGDALVLVLCRCDKPDFAIVAQMLSLDSEQVLLEAGYDLCAQQ